MFIVYDRDKLHIQTLEVPCAGTSYDIIRIIGYNLIDLWGFVLNQNCSVHRGVGGGGGSLKRQNARA